MKLTSSLLTLPVLVAALAPLAGCFSTAAPFDTSPPAKRSPVDCPPLDVVYTSTGATGESFPIAPVAVGDTLYYQVETASDGLEIVSLAPGGTPTAIARGIADMQLGSLSTDGTSLFWVSHRGIAYIALAGGVVFDGPESPVLGGAQSFAHDATTFYAITQADPPVVVAQSFTSGELRTLGTLPDWKERNEIYDDGNRLLVVHTVMGADGSSMWSEGYAVPKDGSPATPVTLASDSFYVVSAQNGALLGNTPGDSLTAFALDGSERRLLPDTPFGVMQGAVGSDGTAYVAGYVDGYFPHDDVAQVAFAAVSPDGRTTFLQCSAQSKWDGMPAIVNVTVGASAVYGVLARQDRSWDLVKFPK